MVSAQGEGSIPSIRQLKKLLKVYSKTLQRHPNDLDLRTKLAEVLRLLDRKEEAIALYSSVAWAHGVAGHLGQSIMLCKIILQLSPDHSETQQMLAKLYASQRIREAKQSVPVVKVDGRWVADPRGSGVSKVEEPDEPTPSRPGATVTPVPIVTPKVASVELEAPDSSRLRWDEGDDDAEEPTRDESPSNPELVAKRERESQIDAGAPELSSELPTPKERPGPADLLPQPLESDALDGSIKLDPGGKERGPFAKAKTILKDRVVVTADEDGQLVVDASAGEGAEVRPTMQLPPTKVEEVAAKVPSPDPALGPAGKSGEEVTHLVPDDEVETQLEEGVAVEEPTQLEEGVAVEEPTQLEEERITEKSGPHRLAEQPTPNAGIEPDLVTEKDPPRQVQRYKTYTPAEPDTNVDPPPPVLDPQKTHEVQDIDVVAEATAEPDTDVEVDDAPEALPQVQARSVPEAIKRVLGPEDAAARPAERRISTGQLAKAESEQDNGETHEATKEPAGPQPVDYSLSGELATEVHEEPPPIPDDADEELDDKEKEQKEALLLTTTGMMNRLASTMPSRPSAEYHSEAASGPPEPGEVEMVATGDVEAKPTAESAAKKLHRRTSPGFLSAVDKEEVGKDPIRFLRTTRRYGTIETVGRPARDTLVDQIDPNLVSGVMRMDQQAAQTSDDSNKGYATLQKEVRAAGREQDDHEPDADEQAEAERSILDTLRDLPKDDDLDADEGLPRTPFPLFSDLDTPAFLAMVEMLERRVCDAGSLVFQEGDPGDSLFLVSSGNLEVLKQDDKGRLVKLARLGPGSFFGEFALLTDRHRHASVRCIDECELLELRRETLLELIRAHPSISWTLRTFYQQRLMAMVLATSPLFQAVSPEDRRAVLARFAIKRIIEGETIIEEGRPGTGFYIILVGEVAVSCLADDGTEVPLGKLSEGDYFGEISLLTGTAAEATVRANAITEVLTLGANDFYDLASAHPEIWAEVQGEAERRQRDTAARLAEQARQVKAAGPLCLI
jgi:CRP-like cAMP-binding protein